MDSVPKNLFTCGTPLRLTSCRNATVICWLQRKWQIDHFTSYQYKLYNQDSCIRWDSIFTHVFAIIFLNSLTPSNTLKDTGRVFFPRAYGNYWNVHWLALDLFLKNILHLFGICTNIKGTHYEGNGSRTWWKV